MPYFSNKYFVKYATFNIDGNFNFVRLYYVNSYIDIIQNIDINNIVFIYFEFKAYKIFSCLYDLFL